MNFGIAELKEITVFMSKYPDMDYSNYTLSFLARRLSLIFNTLRIKHVESFYQNLGDAEFRERVKTLMCVAVTEMFRDPAFWRNLRSKILKNLPENSDAIWLPLASGGEEAYSLSILLKEKGMDENFKILCNNPTSFLSDQIHKGILDNKQMDVNQTNYRRLEDQDNFQNYFDHNDKVITVSPEITKNIECVTGDFATHLPHNRNIGAILFRNISLYYSPRMAESIYRVLIEQLMPGGFFVVGIKDNLPKSVEEGLIVIDEADRIYQKPILKRKQNYAHF